MIRCLAVIVAAFVLSAACGSSDQTEAASSAITQNAEVADLLGVPLTEDDVEAEGAAIYSRGQELIAQCMAAAGFEYQPVPVEIGRAQQVPRTETSLGVTDQFFGFFDENYVEPPEDPNRAIIDALSDDERDAYEAALSGVSAPFDPRLDSTETLQQNIEDATQNPSGCRATSFQTAIDESDRNPILIEQYQELRAGMLSTDQRMIRAQREWILCMSEAGYNYSSEGAIRDDLSARAGRILTDLADEGIALMPFEDPPQVAVELIDELRAEEAAVAAAAGVCREPLNEAIAEVRDDVDALFLGRNS